MPSTPISGMPADTLNGAEEIPAVDPTLSTGKNVKLTVAQLEADMVAKATSVVGSAVTSIDGTLTTLAGDVAADEATLASTSGSLSAFETSVATSLAALSAAVSALGTLSAGGGPSIAPNWGSFWATDHWDRLSKSSGVSSNSATPPTNFSVEDKAGGPLIFSFDCSSNYGSTLYGWQWAETGSSITKEFMFELNSISNSNCVVGPFFREPNGYFYQLAACTLSGKITLFRIRWTPDSAFSDVHELDTISMLGTDFACRMEYESGVVTVGLKVNDLGIWNVIDSFTTLGGPSLMAYGFGISPITAGAAFSFSGLMFGGRTAS